MDGISIINENEGGFRAYEVCGQRTHVADDLRSDGATTDWGEGRRLRDMA